jgi:hypothetical protein
MIYTKKNWFAHGFKTVPHQFGLLIYSRKKIVIADQLQTSASSYNSATHLKKMDKLLSVNDSDQAILYH